MIRVYLIEGQHIADACFEREQELAYLWLMSFNNRSEIVATGNHDYGGANVRLSPINWDGYGAFVFNIPISDCRLLGWCDTDSEDEVKDVIANLK